MFQYKRQNQTIEFDCIADESSGGVKPATRVRMAKLGWVPEIETLTHTVTYETNGTIVEHMLRSVFFS